MALRDRQILAYLEQFGSDVAEAVFDFVKAYRAGLARSARLVLKGHLRAGGIVNWLLTKRMGHQSVLIDQMRLESLQRLRARQWRALRLNWTPREERYWKRLDERSQFNHYHRVFGWLVFGWGSDALEYAH